MNYLNQVAVISVPGIHIGSTLAGCLAGCGLAASKPIIECAKKHKTIVDFKNCVQNKGLSIAANAVVCLLACLGVSATVP